MWRRKGLPDQKIALLVWGSGHPEKGTHFSNSDMPNQAGAATVWSEKGSGAFNLTALTVSQITVRITRFLS